MVGLCLLLQRLLLLSTQPDKILWLLRSYSLQIEIGRMCELARKYLQTNWGSCGHADCLVPPKGLKAVPLLLELHACCGV